MKVDFSLVNYTFNYDRVNENALLFLYTRILTDFTDFYLVKDDDDEDDGVDITNPIEETNEETDDNSLDAQSEFYQNLALRYSDESEHSDPCDDTDHFQRPISTTDPSMILYYNIICAFI